VMKITGVFYFLINVHQIVTLACHHGGMKTSVNPLYVSKAICLGGFDDL